MGPVGADAPAAAAHECCIVFSVRNCDALGFLLTIL